MTNKRLPKLTKKERAHLKELLLDSVGDNEELYAIVDSAKDGSIPHYLNGLKANYRVLLTGEGAKGLESVAPYIVRLEESANTVNWYLEKVYGNGIGFVVASMDSIEQLADQWAGIIETKVPSSGHNGYFRVYDPVVLRSYLEILDEDGELGDFFEHLGSLLVEADNTVELICYRKNSKDKFNNEIIVSKESIHRAENMPRDTIEKGAIAG
ncbi:DUF4123 domain-containing protein [Kangiella marina]|uniref:DUF4123 domain-containing protein n=1 Tax=Kangiella marina TaxID=1079178 RepID=A0ABP8IJQ6_9GAMM